MNLTGKKRQQNAYVTLRYNFLACPVIRWYHLELWHRFWDGPTLLYWCTLDFGCPEFRRTV